MPFLFIDDGSPEAEDCADNYAWFDAADPRSVQRVLARRDGALAGPCAQGRARRADGPGPAVSRCPSG
jgi:hypothetical protein